MPMPGMLYNIIQMDLENLIPLKAKPKVEKCKKCECLLTSEKIRHVLTKFPASQPIPPRSHLVPNMGYPNENVCRECIATNLKSRCHPIPDFPTINLDIQAERLNVPGSGIDANRTRQNRKKGRAWTMVGEMIQLLHFAVVATALALYYVIYGWMNFVYVALRVALYFRNADRPMKITIGVVAVTSLLVGLNILLRIRKLYTSILR